MKLPSVPVEAVARGAAAFALSSMLLVPTFGPVPPALADGDTKEFKFPPVDRTNKNRCKWTSSAMGQANAARDSLYDLRECEMSGTNAAGFDISGALLAAGDFSKTNFVETQFSKVYAPDAKFDGAYFKGASFRGAIFKNAVLSGSTFEDTDLTDS